MHPRRIVVAAALAALLAATSMAHAQSAEAEQLFRDGDRLMTEGKLREACEAFDGSNRIEPRAGTLIRLGECRENNHQLASAWSAYADALARVKDPRKREVAQAAITAIEPRLSKLTISVASPRTGLTLTRNGKPVDAALWGRAVPIDGGEQVLVASAPGFIAATVTVSVPIERASVTARIPVLEPQPTVARTDPAAPVVAVPPVGSSPSVPSSFTGRRKVAVLIAVVGVAAFGGAGILGRSAKSREDDAFALCPDPATPCARSAEATEKLDSAHARATYTNVALGIGGAAIAGAVALWITGAPRAESHGVAVTPHVAGSAFGLSLGGSF